ncbi:MAG TPA: sugar ABC transporter ATP-binding protein [Verrucomicrobia bacterium]|nr:sugar ABC transporter ATP-binding protein [Verrucomicrobiota bacterium]
MPDIHSDPSTPTAVQPRLLLRGTGLDKRFPGVHALQSVDFDLRPGEVHALMGENGAGKSTLIKVLTGFHRKDAGTVLLEDVPIDPASPKEAEATGISTVYQEVNLIPHLSVAENIGLGRQPTRFGLIQNRAIKQRAQQALARVGLKIDVSNSIAECSIAIRQLVAIARAIDLDAKVLILDEPTSSLDAGETAQLFEVVRNLKAEGIGIIFVTHFLDQVYQISDRITVLRNGRLIGTWPAPELPRIQLIEAMTGNKFSEQQPRTASVEAGTQRPAEEAVIQVKRLGRRNSIAPTSFHIHAGETLGIAGLLGSGRTELARLVFGIDRADSGEVRINGKPIRNGSIPAAIQAKMAFSPEDRKFEGIIPELSVRENIILALQAQLGPLRPISRAEQIRLADQYIQALKIKTPSPEFPVQNLSGGNQQKVLLARWLVTQPKFLLLDEPTRGIDVGAKAEIENLTHQLCQEGMAILFISSELDEIVRTSDRVLVLRDKMPIGEVAKDELTEPFIMQMIAKHEPEGAAN